MTESTDKRFIERRRPPCQSAESCAEHARYDDDSMMPCNDGRDAHIYGRRKDDKPVRKKKV